MVDQVFHQRLILFFCLLGQHAGRLIDQDYMLILINNMKLCLFYLLNLYFREFLYGFICQKQLDFVALGKLFGTITFLTVQHNVFFAHHLVKKSLPGQIQIFRQQLIQALSGFIFIYHYGSHGKGPPLYLLTWTDFSSALLHKPPHRHPRIRKLVLSCRVCGRMHGDPGSVSHWDPACLLETAR